jgi:fluoride exporter
MYKPLLAIAIGSIAGGLLRWFFGLKLNALFPTMPLGTLAANLLAAYIIGATAAFLATSPSLAPEWRLLIMTGFCGGLSTFSTFSIEIVYLLQRGLTGWALGEIAVHVAGSVAMTFAGILSVQLLRPH